MLEKRLSGTGRVTLDVGQDVLWDALLDPAVLRSLVPGCSSVERPTPERLEIVLSYGVGRFSSRYVVEIALSDIERPSSLGLSGSSSGQLGRGNASARVRLEPEGADRTTVDWSYEGRVGGTVALAGASILQAGATRFITRFFQGLSERVASGMPVA